MNILIETINSPFCNGRVGGAETSLKLIAEKLTKKNHKVIFIGRQSEKTYLGYSKRLIGGIVVITYSKFKFSILNSYKFKKVSNQLKSLHQIYLMRSNKIEIVHTYYNYSLLKKYTALKEKCKFKLIVRIAGLKVFEEIKDSFGEDRKISYFNFFEKIDLFNFISEGLKQMFLKETKNIGVNFEYKNHFVGDIGVDIEGGIVFKVAKENTGEFNIVMVTRFSNYQKRQDLLVRAMSLVKYPNVKLTLIGDGPNKENIQKLINTNKLTDKVLIKPFVQKELLWEQLLNYDLLVHACDYEGLSKIIIESMIHGLPVLVSDVLPLNSYISDGINGYLIKNDEIYWAQKINFLFENSLDFMDITQNAKNYISLEYDANKNISIYEKRFLEILKS